MKNIKILFALFFLTGLFTACQEDMPELGELPSAEELEFEISQNPNDPNMVILESQTPGVIPFWVHPMGRSTRQQDTVRLAFPGTYKFVYGAQSSAGLVTADTVTLEITTTNLSYVDDPLWNNLTGGVGNEKAWVLDTEAKYFAGPLSFYGTSNGWLAGGGTWDGGETGCYGDDCWTWSPDLNWIYGNAMTQGDYGVMTFSLEGGAQFTAEKLMEDGVTETSSYFLNVGDKTLTINDASILRGYKPDRNGLSGISDWNNYTVLELTEDVLRLGVIRDNDVDGEGAAMVVYNFISQEYSENWVPEDQPDPEPDLPDGWYEDVTSIVDTELEWVLSPETPFNWAGLDGAFLNDWTSVEDYPDWSGFDASVPATYENFSLIMDSQDSTVEYVAPDGSVTTGTYTLDEDGVFTFEGVDPSFDIGTAIDFNTTADNQLRILQIEKGPSGAVTGMWVGARDPEKPEYLAYHLILQEGGEEDPTEPEGTEIAFDNANLVIGDLEGNGNLRLELFNEYGSTKANPPLDPSAVIFSDRIEITFTLQGVSFVEGAAGSYDATIGLADTDWSVNSFGNVGPGSETVTGDGTYTVYVEPGSAYDGAVVLVVDVLGMAPDIEDLSAVTATIDNVVIY